MDENNNNSVYNSTGDGNSEQNNTAVQEEQTLENVQEQTGEAVQTEQPQTVTEEDTAPAYDGSVSSAFNAEETHTEAARLEPAPEKKAGRRKNGALMAITVMCTLLCAASLVFAVSIAFNNSRGSFKMPEVYTPDYQYTSTITPDNAVLLDKASVIEKVLPSAVLIKTTIQTSTASGSGMGSGFVFTSDGLIVTNAHVVSDATSIEVTLHDGTVYTAELVGADKSTDIAVIRIDAKNLTPVDIGDSSKMVVGEDVIAIGNPYDEKLAFTSTSGMISAIRDNFHFDQLGVVLDVFQHDAAINSGNSGGPLVNMYGQVIGINSVKISGYDNIGFAIEINSVIDVIEDLINNGSVQRPTIGISCITDSNIGGVTVHAVNEGSAAEKAGIKVGDIITKFEGTRVKTSEELITLLSKHAPGDECTITVLRDAESLTMTIVLDVAY